MNVDRRVVQFSVYISMAVGAQECCRDWSILPHRRDCAYVVGRVALDRLFTRVSQQRVIDKTSVIPRHVYATWWHIILTNLSIIFVY